jgi:hypothetical protein
MEPISIRVSWSTYLKIFTTEIATDSHHTRLQHYNTIFTELQQQQHQQNTLNQKSKSKNTTSGSKRKIFFSSSDSAIPFSTPRSVALSEVVLPSSIHFSTIVSNFTSKNSIANQYFSNMTNSFMNHLKEIDVNQDESIDYEEFENGMELYW